MSGSNALTIARDPTVQVSPLAAITAGMQAAGSVYELRQKQAVEAAGQAYQGAINPQTGEFDPNEFRRRLAASGPAAMAAGHELTNTQQISSDQLKQNLEKAKWVNSTAGALLLQGDYSDAAMLGALHNGVAGGILTLPEAQRQLATMPPDAAGRKRWLEEHRDTSGSYAEQVQQQYGTAGTEIDPSGRRVGTVQQPPRAGGGISTQPQAGVPLGLDPGQTAQYQQWLQGEVEIPDPNNPGGTQKATRIQMFQRMGVDPKLFYPGGGGSGGGSAPQTSPNAASPNAPSASPNLRTPPPPNASPNAGKPLTVASPADVDTQKAGAQMGIALSQRAGQVPDNQANLGNMLADAAKLDSMGAGSAREAYLNSFFQKWSGSGLLGNSTREQIAAAESFNKIGNIMAANQMAALGASDARQQLSIGANPHLDLSKLGNEQIIHMLQGNEDAIAAKSRAWEDWKLTHGSGSYAQFQNDLNKDFDLRVFQQRYMSQPEIDAMKAQMKSQGTDKEFIRKVLEARKRGWIQ